MSRGSALLALAALIALPARGAADPPRAGGGTAPDQDFWGWLLEPHKPEVDLVLRKAAGNRNEALRRSPYDSYQGYDAAWATRRRELLADAEGMLRYALELQPDSPRLLRELAIVTDERGRPSAREHLERYLAVESPDRSTADARMRLGRWYARERRFGEAIAQLRLALGGRPDARTALAARQLLALVYMQTGRLAEAIDLLRGGLVGGHPPGALPDYATPYLLAVAYDRDEQITLAHQTLEQIARLSPDALSQVLIDQHGNRLEVLPGWERHYLAALQFEVLGQLVEARAEWLAYLRWDEAPYRARARQHLVAVERMLRDQATGRAARPAPPRPHAPVPPVAPAAGGTP